MQRGLGEMPHAWLGNPNPSMHAAGISDASGSAHLKGRDLRLGLRRIRAPLWLTLWLVLAPCSWANNITYTVVNAPLFSIVRPGAPFKPQTTVTFTNNAAQAVKISCTGPNGYTYGSGIAAGASVDADQLYATHGFYTCTVTDSAGANSVLASFETFVGKNNPGVENPTIQIVNPPSWQTVVASGGPMNPGDTITITNDSNPDVNSGLTGNVAVFVSSADNSVKSFTNKTLGTGKSVSATLPAVPTSDPTTNNKYDINLFGAKPPNATSVTLLSDVIQLQTLSGINLPAPLNQNTYYVSGAASWTPLIRATLANNAVGNVVTAFRDRSTETGHWIFQAYVYGGTDLGAYLGLDPYYPSLVTVFKRDAGDSAYGVNPVAAGQMVSFMSANNPFDSTGTLVRSASMNTVSAYVDLGVADMEPGVFQTPQNLPLSGGSSGAPLWAPLTSGQVATLSTEFMFLRSYGVAVNNNLYLALQAAQGTSGVPSISLAQVQSLVNATGLSNDGVQSWGYLLGNNGNSSQVNIVRLVPGNGAQAGASIVFSNACSISPETPLTATDSDATSLGSSGNLYVLEASTPAGVKAGLDAADTAGPNVYAIGYLSYDQQPGSADTYHFVNLDGRSPNIANVQQGNYFWAFANTLNYNSTYAASHAGSQAFVNAFVASLVNPATFARLSTAQQSALVPFNSSSISRRSNSCSLLVISR